jgi:hypothetical protein
LVDGDKVDAFLEAQKHGPFYPDKFSKIIEKGYGRPFSGTRSRIESEYGFRHQGMENK